MPHPRRHASAGRGEDGAIAILVAISAVTLFMIAALVVDLGLARDTRRQSQNAADAAALAGANALYPASGKCSDNSPVPSTGCKADAANAAQAYAEANFAVTGSDWARCGTPPAGFAAVPSYPTCISVDAVGQHIWVVMPVRSVKTGLGNAAGVSEVPVGSSARATVLVGARSECGLCLLGKNMQHYVQTGDLVVNGTDVRANGDLGTQQINGHVTVTNGTVGVQGSITGNVTSQKNTPNAGEVLDPLAALALPSDANSWFGTPTVPRPKTNPCTQGPGFYNGISLAGNGAPCVLQAGTYVITGDFKVAGQRAVNASAGVTLYFTCGTGAHPSPCADGGENGGSMTWPGQGELSISPPTSGPLKGISIASDRNNTSTLSFRGNGAGGVKGTIYAASGTLDYRGNGAGTTDSLVIVRDLSFSGNNSRLSLVYSAANNVELPPSDPALDR